MNDKFQAFDIQTQATPEVTNTVHLPKGPCTLTVIAPFDTSVTVLPVQGLAFRDLNSDPNVFNAEFNVAIAGQYSFTILMSKPVPGERLHIHFASNNDAGSGGGSVGNNELPEYPAQPTPGWRFVYYMRFSETGFNRTDVVGWGANARIYRYHTNTENAVWETLRNIRSSGINSYQADVIQIPGLVQGFDVSEDWKRLSMGVAMKYQLERKIRA